MKNALILAALLLVAIIPMSEAAGVEPRPWAPYSAVSTVNALAMAREGTTIAAALGLSTTTSPAPQPGVPNAPAPCSDETTGGVPVPGATSVGACTDLSILDFEYGFARNGTILSQTPLGRTHVAVSRDGGSIATVGIDGSSPAQQALHLRYMRVASGGNWSTSTPYERDLILGPSNLTTAGLAVSDDGRTVAVLLAVGLNYELRTYSYGNALTEGPITRAPGAPRAMAGSGDLQRILIVGQFVVGNFSYGGGYLLAPGQSEPLASYFDTSANGTDARSAAISRNGMTAAIGGGDGRVHVFHGGNLATDTVASLGGGAVGNITLSEDGSRFAASSGQRLTNFDTSNSGLVILWNATLSGQNVTGLAMNRTGAILVAATGGTGGGVYGFDESNATPLWSIPGDTRAVAIDSDATRVAYAQRSAVGAVKIPRALTMELVSGGKIAPQRTVTLPGSATYEVTLRNDGAVTERVLFEEGAPEIGVTSDPASVLVRPGAIIRVNLTVTVNDPLPGPRVFNITARAMGSGIVDNITLSLAPTPTLDVKLKLNETDILTQPGETSTILLTIVNNGTSDANVALAATQTVSAGADWGLTISETQLTALRGTRASVKVLMTPPLGVANGTSTTVKFTLQGQDVFDTAQVTFRVNPDLKVELNATGVTKLIEPGKRGHYNVTVTNTGSLPRQFEVFYAITESSGRSWNVDMPTQTVRIDPLQKRVFPVTIIAPADASPGDRVSVRVSARSIPEQVNETAVIHNVTLFGVAVELKIPTPSTTPSGIPFLGPAALVAITLVAAVLSRRRP